MGGEGVRDDGFITRWYSSILNAMEACQNEGVCAVPNNYD